MHKLFGAGAGFRRWQPKRIRSEDEKKYLFVTPQSPTKGCCLFTQLVKAVRCLPEQ